MCLYRLFRIGQYSNNNNNGNNKNDFKYISFVFRNSYRYNQNGGCY